MATRENHTGRRSDGRVLCETTLADAIEIGDEMLLDTVTNTVRPASTQADAGTLLGNQQNFRAARFGVAETAKLANEAGEVTVGTNLLNEYHVTAVSAVYRRGDTVGLNENGAGDALLNQTYIAIAAVGDATHKVVDDDAAARTRIKVRAIVGTLSNNS